ncbi:MAG: EpsI family protein [Desulfamplus sp.]|nr:EpsI family protein [Desulfamplus sp.]
MRQIFNQTFLNPVVQSSLLLIAFVIAYFVPFKSLYNTWMTNDDYSYCILIPFISAYLLWEQREHLKNIQIKSYWPIFPLLLIFILISLYGVLGSSGHISRPVLPALIILFTIFCFGINLSKKIALPLGFIFFMIPLPNILDRTIGVFLKSLSSQLGGITLRYLGYSVHVSGNIIDLGITKLQVVDACSGLRFLFPLIALGIIYSYFFEKVMWKRILCVVATIPIAILSNVLRIVITGILTYRYSSKMAEGFFHDFQGWTIFMISFLFLFVFGRCLRIFPSKAIEIKEKIKTDIHNKPQKPRNSGAILMSLSLLLIVAGFSWSTSIMPPILLKGGIANFPLSFSDWKGQQQIVEPEIIEASGAEESFSGFYQNKTFETVSLYMGYRSSAFLENTNFFHSPTVCLPSSGWKTIEQTKHIIKNISIFTTLAVTKIVMSDDMGNQHLVYFWFQTKDKATHDKNINRFHLAIHAIKRDNTHDLFIRQITKIKDNETIQSAEERLDKFAKEMITPLNEFLKDNQYLPKSES